jgi:hypothetical protein
MGLELNLTYLPNDVGHISGFGEEGAGVKGLDAM